MIFTPLAAYRSVFVCKYVSQAAWFDTVANSSRLVRGLAFFAEVSFAGQFALILRRIQRELYRGGSAVNAPPPARLDKGGGRVREPRGISVTRA